MTAWYKEPKYNGAGIIEQIDLKKAIPALAMAAAPVVAEAAKPVAQNLGQRASKHIDKKGINVPITGVPIGPRLKIGGDKKMEKELPTDAMTMTNKSLVKSIDTFLMRKGILQKTANKSGMALGSYQKLGDPVKRMVNNSATIQSPDVWSAGKKTTKTKE